MLSCELIACKDFATIVKRNLQVLEKRKRNYGGTEHCLRPLCPMVDSD